MLSLCPVCMEINLGLDIKDFYDLETHGIVKAILRVVLLGSQSKGRVEVDLAYL